MDAPRPRPLRIIGLAGAAGAGKDLSAGILGGERVSFSDPIYRGLAAMLGVPESSLRDRASKELPGAGIFGRSPRQLLQTLGTDWGRERVSPEVWVALAAERWCRAIAAGVPLVVVPDVRFPNEAAAIRAAGGEVWLIHRPDAGEVSAHSSESGLPLAAIDRLVVNDADVEQLQRRLHQTWLASWGGQSAARSR